MAKRVPLFWKLAVESDDLRCFKAEGMPRGHRDNGLYRLIYIYFARFGVDCDHCTEHQ